MVIRDFWQTAPNSPGVYRMIDADGDVLYVGKARHIKKRIASYIKGIGHGGNRTARMIAETAAMEFVVTQTETEALLLEANLIKQLRPRYNVLLRDDKSFPYILLTGDHPAPQLVKHRGARNRKGDYYGPFASAGAVTRTVNALQRAFLLRTCTDSYYENRSRPCLLFQIKRCSAPCTGEIDLDDYAGLVAEARAFLSGRSTAVKKALAAEMQHASEELEFERAARYRDRLAALSAVQATQDVNPQSVEEADVFAIDLQAGQFCVQVFFFRNYQNWGNRAYFPKADAGLTPDEVLSSFIAQFYDDKPCPRLVLLSHDLPEQGLLAEALSTQRSGRVEVATPRRGEKRDLVEHALKNAKEALARRLADSASQEKLLGGLAKAFGLAAPPRRIEVYDNSHIMGTNAVGAMIVAGRQGFMKTHYRTFNIRSEDLTPGDDFGMMREVLSRRFARLLKEAPRGGADLSPASAVAPEDMALPLVGAGGGIGEMPLAAPSRQSSSLPEGAEATLEAELDAEPDDDLLDDDSFPAWPDLVLIDGGRGQLEAARAALAEIGITDVPLVGVAKGADRDAGRETFVMAERAPFKLAPRDPALYFIQRLRDEAHRFAIGTHRAKRKRAFTKNPLDEITGIGPSRKRALLLHFGTAKAVSRASLEDLQRAPGINAATARTIYEFFHENQG
ncbi:MULTISPECIES: excinuclease ABC subunit UvrC [unclassified Chelatococcus]|uniref:excinuclease ABC subunit UvrC n=1 Tax=unclassified Chelatococcus TaxID=2638111 RepID=UPI001BD12188|nr:MULTISPECIES: excinuclease ABC subunit UvrC [unclassified Chelatococcus]MBS7697762.1 excinuclease ABC subunit UvrC [Chelatococcus sp. YT9]MBX3558381.1 excinuclease ABC subunit UvrC [Chelatococcus sp.]